MQTKNSEKNVIWSPQPRQIDFMSSPIFEVLMGGAAGGGKSDALLMEGLRQIHIPGYRAIMFRRTTKQLRRLIDRAYEIFTKAVRGVESTQGGTVWTFPSGAKYILSHMEEEKNKYDHDGQEYQYIAFDELTSFTETQYLYLFSRCRSSDPNIRCYIRSSGMPIGTGLIWVKQRFIDNGSGVIVLDKDTGLSRQYIFVNLDDNKYLKDNDPVYENRLKLLGDNLFLALRYGNWNIVEGAFFSEWNEREHVISPTIPTPEINVWRAMDWGFAKPFSIGWFYQDYDKNIIHFHEWYGCNGKANEGLRMSAREVAKGIKEIEKVMGLQISEGYADPSCWSKQDNTPSIIENMKDEGVDWLPANNNRLQSIMEIHNRLKEKSIKITSNCKHFIRTFPMLQTNLKKPEDFDSDGEDHAADMLRYSIMSRPCVKGYGDIYEGSDTVTSGMSW